MHTFPIQIRFNDVDLLGHVNNVIYGHYFDLARHDFMMKTLGGVIDLRHSRRILIMVHTEYDFVRPSFLSDQLNVETALHRIGAKSVHFTQQIIDDKGILRVKSLSVMATYDKETGSSFEITPEWKQALSKTC